MVRSSHAPAWLVLGCASILVAESARAADTVETWEPGAADVDFYLGAEGLGAKRAESSVYSDLMIGFGLVPRLSTYLGTTLQGNGLLAAGEATLYLGVFGTPIDTDHFDLDLFLDVSNGGAGFSRFEVAPSVELNFDLDPDMGSWGTYLRLGSPMYGLSRETDSALAEEHLTAWSFSINPGTYLTLAEGHQLFVEADMALHGPMVDAHPVDLGGVALGYNAVSSERLELITQTYLDVPQAGERLTAGVMVGFIATMP